MSNPLANVDLGKSVAGAPLGVWVVGIGGAIGFVLYRRNSAGSSVPAEEAAPEPLYPGVGNGAVGGYVDNTTAAPADPGAITDNASWGRAAINYLIAQNYDPALGDSAVRKYLLSAGLSVTEYALMKVVLMKFGPPPEALPQAPAPAPVTPQAPAPPVSVPGPVKPAPAPAPAPVAWVHRYHTVVPGDNLHKISSMYFGNSAKWSDIYNNNRAVIGGNPDLIRPGQVLLIW